MSSRITRKDIEAYIGRLNASVIAETGRDPHLGYSVWSPGDGWTRYQLTADYGSRTFGHVMKLGEFYSFLVTLSDLRSFIKHL